MTPTPTSRRAFIKYAGLAAAATSLSAQKVLGANDRVRVAMLGCGGRSRSLSRQFSKIAGVELVALCDPDTRQMAIVAGLLKEIQPEKIQDYRDVLARPDIDAVIIASPNYWHTPMAIQAMQAGKHVYVEKPVSFNIWEGAQIMAAEGKYGKIIAAGCQNRSDPGPQNGIRYVQEGHLGKIKKVRSLCYRNRASIGKLETPLVPPATVDYDLWLGPAQDQPIMRPQFHYDWHWIYNTGNGDLGNQGVHEIDMVCWLLGDPPLPTQVQSFGNRFAWNDAGNTPNMLSAWYQVDDVDVILETNDMKLTPDRNVSPARFGTRVGIVAECENGILRGGRGGMFATELDGKTIIERFPGDGGGSHQKNFIDAIRANDSSILKSSIQTAPFSATLANLADISYRTGSLVSVPELLSKVGGSEDLKEIITDQNNQLAAWGLENPQYYLGRPISVDPKTYSVTSPFVGTELTGPHYRKGYELKAIT